MVARWVSAAGWSAGGGVVAGACPARRAGGVRRHPVAAWRPGPPTSSASCCPPGPERPACCPGRASAPSRRTSARSAPRPGRVPGGPGRSVAWTGTGRHRRGRQHRAAACHPATGPRHLSTVGGSGHVRYSPQNAVIGTSDRCSLMINLRNGIHSHKPTTDRLSPRPRTSGPRGSSRADH